jgi:uncharacterized protein (UPF0218 family)
VLKLPKSLRKELKEPFGDLHKSIDVIEEPLRKQLQNNNLIIGIGDVTTRNLIELGIQPQICIVDNKIERRPVQNNLDHTDNIKYINNPAGTLTEELLDAIEDAISTVTQEKPEIIVVDGEEDLAVIPCILNSPDNTYILYGQPQEGVVLVKVDEAHETANNIFKQLIKE